LWNFGPEPYFARTSWVLFERPDNLYRVLNQLVVKSFERLWRRLSDSGGVLILRHCFTSRCVLFYNFEFPLYKWRLGYLLYYVKSERVLREA
ncbi:hypothetical protein GIB67_035085, partial [Kingdonia uniflora]